MKYRGQLRMQKAPDLEISGLSPNAMHHCLDIPELICIIFELVSSNRDIVALALTCKTFRDPALRTLWAKLPSFDPLVRCLPNDIWKEEVKEFTRNSKRVFVTNLVRMESYISVGGAVS
jgi:hypothetical protein